MKMRKTKKHEGQDYVKKVILMNYGKWINLMLRIAILAGVVVTSMVKISSMVTDYEYKLAETTTSQMAALIDKISYDDSFVVSKMCDKCYRLRNQYTGSEFADKVNSYIKSVKNDAEDESEYVQKVFVYTNGEYYSINTEIDQQDSSSEDVVAPESQNISGEDISAANVSEQKWYKTALSNKGTVCTISPYSDNQKSDMVNIVVSSDDGKLIAGLSLSSTRLQNTVKKATKSQYGITNLQDENGMLIASANTEFQGMNIGNIGVQSELPDEKRPEKFTEFDSNVSSIEADGKSNYVFSKDLENGWQVSYLLRDDEFNSTLNKVYLGAEFVLLILIVLNIISYVESYKMQKRAISDPLTGLINRLGFIEGLKAILRHRRHRRNVIIYMDLDDFKEINDGYGHEYGDAVLTEVSRRMECFDEKKSLFGRMGGDEFVGVLYNVKSMDGIFDKCNELIDDITRPITFNGKELKVGCSMGLAVSTVDGHMADELIKAADANMYIAKKSGKNKLYYVKKHI